jgi:cytochrome c2
MIQGTLDRGQGRADISVPAGCPLCAGALDLRVTANSAFSYCAQCHRISRSVVAVGPHSLEVAHPPGGVA